VLPSKLLTIDKITPNISAERKPSILNPGTMLAAKYKIKTLMTMENRPKVSRLIGNVNSIKSGLIRLLSIPNTTATTTAFKNELT